MPIYNHPIKHEPKCWGEVMFQDHIVRRLRRMIRQNSWSPSIFACGSSGSGKTSSIRLMINTTHCLNRQPGEDEGCGHCSACLSDPVESDPLNNVIWVKPSSQDSSESDKQITYEAQIKNALAAAQRGPYSTGAPHRDVLFVVFDECHLMPDNLRQRALSFADVLNPLNGDVVLVFITMSPENIKSTPFIALTQRGSYLRFAQPTTKQVEQFLGVRFPDSHPESRRLIAQMSCNSLRGAIQLYKECEAEDKYVSPEVVADVLRVALPEQRMKLWQMLEASTGSKKNQIREMLEYLCEHVEPEYLMVQMRNDLLDSMDYCREDDFLRAAEMFFVYFTSPSEFNAFYLLLELSGKKLINPAIFEECKVYA